MAINSDADICNLSLSYLGQKGTVTDIDTPTKDIERIFKLHFDVTRNTLLKMIMPNFSLARKRVAQITSYTADDEEGYAYAYQQPTDMLKLLGIGNAYKKQNNYIVEGDSIYSDELYEDGAYIRYIKTITDVSKFSDEFKNLLALYLAIQVCIPITQSTQKKQLLQSELQGAMMTVSSLSAQENRPILRSTSRFKQSRTDGFAHDVIKK